MTKLSNIDTNMKILRLSFNRRSLNASEARHLTSMFLGGETDPSDEKLLYEYYSRSHIDPSLERYREMFAWYASMDRTHTGSNRVRRNRIIAAAASLAVAAMIGTGIMLSNRQHVDTPANVEELYAGSYIICNGHKITDIDAILPELQRAEQLVDSTLLAVTPNPVIDNPEIALLENAISSITDPEIREMIKSDILY